MKLAVRVVSLPLLVEVPTVAGDEPTGAAALDEAGGGCAGAEAEALELSDGTAAGGGGAAVPAGAREELLSSWLQSDDSL